ncbi:MAG: DJ-1/PfpI family protein [bacterium]|nr:DJ-1/PfpI family protein [bacterium]
MSKKFGFILPNNLFRDKEYFEPKNILENAGIQVITISKELKQCHGKLGAKVIPELTLKNINISNFAGIAFIGGSGSKEYWHDPSAHQIAHQAFILDKVLAAICSAVATLAFTGLLTNKHANSFQSERTILEKYGAILSNDECVVDGKIITANGLKASKKFGEKILKLLT